MKSKHFIALSDFNKDILQKLVERGIELKQGVPPIRGKDKVLAMIFKKPSTRTNVSFQVAMHKLGGKSIYLGTEMLQLYRGETIEDTTRTLSRYVDAIVIRTYSHQEVMDMAKISSVPIINGLTDLLHPCQAIGDVMTVTEHKGKDYENIKVGFIGDGNNVCNSLINAAGLFGFQLTVASPQGYEPNAKIAEDVSKKNPNIKITDDPFEAVGGSDVVYTDVWVSMGDDEKKKKRRKKFKKFQVNNDLLEKAKSDVMVMHCLPAHRGEEITSEVLDGEKSFVFEQAENRMHIQEAILEFLFGAYEK
ncbi:MAG: ornithine carbamoyltransferase [Elusimicrobiota bacterium]